MRDINRRINTVEKKLSIGTEKAVIRIIVHKTYEEGTGPDIPEQYDDWITYKAALEESIECGKKIGTEFLLFAVDPFREYEARNHLQEGIMTEHRLRGKIPFDELLDRATKSNQKQPKSEKLSLQNE